MILLIFTHLSNHPTHKSLLMGCTMIHVSTLQSGDLYQQVFGCIALIAGHCDLKTSMSLHRIDRKWYGKGGHTIQGSLQISLDINNHQYLQNPDMNFPPRNRTSKTCTNISLKDQMRSIGDETYEFRSLCIYTHQSMSSHKFQK